MFEPDKIAQIRAAHDQWEHSTLDQSTRRHA